MATTQDLINEIKSLRGSNVRIFGQPVTLPSDVSKYEIDICDILEAFKRYELEKELTTVDPSELNEETDEFDIVLDRLVNYGYIFNPEDYEEDNSYNWNAPFSNEFDYKVWITEDEDGDENGTIVAFKIHRYGDVRVNYTDYVWYRFDDNEFLVTIYEAGSKSFPIEDKEQGKTYICSIDTDSYAIAVSEENSYEYFLVFEDIENDEEMLQAIRRHYI